MKKMEDFKEIRSDEEKWFNCVEYNNDIKTLQKLIDKGFNINLEDEEGWTALHWVGSKGMSRFVKLLVNNGADVNIQDEYGWVPLHYACSNNYYNTAELLIENGADVNIQTDYFRTPLHIACYCGHLNIAKFLIDKEADIHIRDKDGDTPLNLLKKNVLMKYEELMQWLAECHPEKALEAMASENIQSKGVGL